MNSAIERLLSLTAGDLMTPAAVCVNDLETMSDAAAVLKRHKISGVPVVDIDGRCVGVLSNADFVRRESTESGQASTVTMTPVTDLVADHMAGDPLTVGVKDSLLAASRLMCNKHVHRLIVVDNDRKPLGIVSSLDVVAALVGAFEE